MMRKIILMSMVLVGMAAAAGPLRVSAGGDPLASPTPQPTQRITAPVISGVNPEVFLSEGEQGEITPSDIPHPVSLQAPITIPAPAYRELDPLPLAVPYQAQAGDVNCGPAALAMAMTYLNQRGEERGITPQEIGSWLEKRGLIYEWGTGVEELAYAARSFGYQGSTALHDWSLEELGAELRSGRPVPVPLGINGPGQPGHFLTVTGISPDGSTVFGLDPQRGAVEFPVREFETLWERQGKSALILRRDPLAEFGDLSQPLMGLVSAVSALTLALGWAGAGKGSRLLAGLRKELADPQRKGIGGGVQSACPGEEREPAAEADWEEAPPGFRKIQVEVPVYETRQVQVGLRGIKREVPVYQTRKIFAGLRKEVEQVPVYRFRKVLTGTRWIEKRIPITRYRSKEVWTWKKVTERVPVIRWIHGKPIVLRYQNQTRWKRVRVTKKVPYQSSKKLLIKEPVYSYKKVQVGTQAVTRWVPRYGEKQVQVGTKTVYQTVPVYEQRQVQVGTRTVTKLVPVPGPVPEPSGAGGDPGDDETQERDPASDLRLLEKLIIDPDQTSPPTGISRAVWDSLSEQDQTRIRQDGLDWLQEYYQQTELQDNRIFKLYRFIQSVKERLALLGEGLGLLRENQSLPHLISLSAQKEVPANLLTEDGIVIDTFRPPYFLDLFYMQQEIDIVEKAVVTLFPDAPIDINLSTKSITARIGKSNLFSDVSGLFGFSYIASERDPRFEEIVNNFSFKFDIDGILIKYKKEGIRWVENNCNADIKTKFSNTLECKVSIIRTEGIVILAASLILLYFLLSSGAGIYLPSWQNLPSLPL